MSRYTVYVVPDEFRSIKRLPGNVRQRVRHAIDDLADNPRPPHSRQLEVAELEGSPAEVRRLRIDNWRVVYLVSDDEKTVDVVAVRKRPPFDYGDLGQLLGRQM